MSSLQKTLNLFHYLSFLQYPLMLLGLYFVYKPIFFGYDTLWHDYNLALIFMGLAISFTTLADPKRANKKIIKLYKNPKFMRGFMVYLMILITFLLGFGFYAMLWSDKVPLQQLSTGIIVLGIGVIGLLKMSVELTQMYATEVK